MAYYRWEYHDEIRRQKRADAERAAAAGEQAFTRANMLG
jgi:hypothetical protein